MTVDYLYGVPHLAIALSGPLYHLKPVLLANDPNIPASLYCPAKARNVGFNELNQTFSLLYTQAIQTTFELHSKVSSLIILEGRNRNLFYLESLAILFKFISKAGFSVPIGSFAPKLKENRHKHPSTVSMTLKPLCHKGNESDFPTFYAYIVCLVLWEVIKAIVTSQLNNKFCILNRVVKL